MTYTEARKKGAVAAVLLSALLAGCTTTVQPKAGSVRSSGETAPADLQLLCASEAATKFNVSGGVLPVSSMPAPGGAFQVNLTMGSSQAVCIIGQDGTVKALEMV